MHAGANQPHDNRSRRTTFPTARDVFKSKFPCRLLTISIGFVLSCAQTPDISGKWQKVGKPSTLELRRDGTFKAVDDMGMTATGNYTLNADGTIRFDVRHENSPSEIIEGRLTVHGDELILTAGDKREIETYKRSP